MPSWNGKAFPQIGLLELNLLLSLLHNASVMRSFDAYLLLIWTSIWTNSRITRRSRHFNVHVMPLYFNLWWIWSICHGCMCLWLYIYIEQATYIHVTCLTHYTDDMKASKSIQPWWTSFDIRRRRLKYEHRVDNRLLWEGLASVVY